VSVPDRIDPASRQALEAMLEQMPGGINAITDLARRREVAAGLDRQRRLESSPHLVIENRTVPASAGHDIPIRICRPQGRLAQTPVVFFIHGGGMVMGGLDGGDPLAARLSKELDALVVSVDYRLAPEHPYPAALEDALNAYRALLADTASREPGRIAVVGESAGAGLATALLVSAREQHLAMPSAGVLFSPYADLTLSGATMTTKAAVDPSFTPEAIAVRMKDYVGAADPADPRISPVFSDLRGLPPLLIQAGSNEVLLDDAVRLAARAAADDVPVALEVTPGVPHLFQAFAAMLEEGEAALQRATEFLHTAFASSGSR
jgi:epsilon-lactone hydrolase